MGERELVGLAGLGVFFLLLILRLPVALAMLVVGIGGNWVLSLVAPFLRFEPYLGTFKSLPWSVFASYELTVVPLFILMGLLASQAGLSRDLFQGLAALIGQVRGGVAIAALGACAGFGAVSGSSLATASTMGRVALPELRRLGYDERMATGTLAAGGTLGILIPPSVALVLYAVIVEASVIAMFQAAVVPGLLALAGFAAVVALRTWRRPGLAPPAPRLPAAERRRAVARLVPVAAVFGAIVAGLGLGLFTPTPAAAVGAGLILVYGLILRLRTGRGLGRSALTQAILGTAETSAMIVFILIGAEVLKGFLARAGLPAVLAEWAGSGAVEPWALLLAMLALLILLGCVMESLSLVLVVVPFFWPALIEANGGAFVSPEQSAFGMDAESLKIWFGILALVVVEVGLITPPVGLNVFIIASLDRETPAGRVFAGVAPFLGAEAVRVALLLALPALTLWLPRALAG